MTITRLLINRNRHPVGSRRYRMWQNAILKIGRKAADRAVRNPLPFNPALSIDERRERRDSWRGFKVAPRRYERSVEFKA